MAKSINRVGAMARSALVAMATAATMGMAAAQTPETPAAGSEESAWVKVCNEVPQTKKVMCLVTQELRTDTGQFLASVAIREIEGEDRKTLLVAVPPGMLIQPGLRVQVDAGKQEQAKYGICFPNACYAELVITKEFIDGMKAGGKLVLTTLNQQAKAVAFDLTLIGFTKIYDGEAVDPKAMAQKQEALQAELQKRAEEARQKLIEQQKKQSEPAN
ncbi:invasion associated locus B family protein [Breoghania sp. L-A4]|uniref:invasion associated locus B family protein n=1 Tax=Breoghania sp. L-A4 TaxID=2304600 RepID=UPI000E35A583|nr:invasion associated locus B family protein [Breoghania sp. L-A4]AXS40579.1 invasion associated locus B family protein [Breoghania sp. L-A4]